MSTGPDPLVSIVIPSYNQGRFIRETIESCLRQDYRPLEILVLDGASTDETVSVLESFRADELRWWSEPDAGVVDAVNKGLRLARGAIISIQSSDDLFVDGALGAAVAALRASPGAGLAYGDVELIDEHSQLVGADRQGDFDLAAYLGRLQYIPQPGTCFTREAMLAAGEWRQSVSYAADADYWMRIAVRLPVVKLARVVGRYRYHADQRDTQRQRIARDWQQAVQDLLDAGGVAARPTRFARMGMHLARHRYASEEAWGERTLALYRAALSNPRAVFDPRFPKRELFPARDPIWRGLSRVKRALGFSPRKS